MKSEIKLNAADEGTTKRKVVVKNKVVQKKGIKTFVLDTNVLIHDPNCLKSFQENNIIIPIMVIKELDKLKNGRENTCLAAREVLRQLDLFRKSSPKVNGWRSLGEGLGSYKIENLKDKDVPEDIQSSPLELTPDERILAVALLEYKKNPLTVLVSKDLNLLEQADALGVPAEDYYNDSVKDTEVLRTPIITLPCIEQKILEKYQGQNNSLFSSESGELIRLNEGNVIPVTPQACLGIYPRKGNIEQIFALNILLDPNVPLVAMTGGAGTGKTLFAVIAALMQHALEKKRFPSRQEKKTARKQIRNGAYKRSTIEQTHDVLEVSEKIIGYEKICVARPTVSLSNKGEGFLPGNLQKKVDPYMEPIYTTLDFIASGLVKNSTDGKKMSIDQMIMKYNIEVKALSVIRGVTLHNTFFIVDEAQNLTPHEIKTIVTRAGEGTKVVFTGDLSQIDNPYLNAYSSGLSFLIDRMKGKSIFAHIDLTKVERSELARIALECLS